MVILPLILQMDAFFSVLFYFLHAITQYFNHNGRAGKKSEEFSYAIKPGGGLLCIHTEGPAITWTSSAIRGLSI